MKTLHHYHWNGKEIFNTYVQLMKNDEKLVVFGTIDATSIDWINNKLRDKQQWFLVNKPNATYKGSNVINESAWLSMIIEHENTLPWK